MAKDYKLLGEAYSKIYEQTPINTNTAAGAPVTTAGVSGAISDTAETDQAKKVFDTAAMTYLKTLGVDEAAIKKFIDTTHTQFSKSKSVSTPAAATTATYLPSTSK